MRMCRRRHQYKFSLTTRFVASAVLFSLMLSQSILTYAQPTNGIVTLVQDTPTTSGGQLGSGNPVSLVMTVGQPVTGLMNTSSVTIRVGYPGAKLMLPAGTRTIAVEGAVNEPVSQVTVNGIAAVITGTAFRADGVQLVEGQNPITTTATDLAGNRASTTITVTLDTQPPARPTIGLAPAVTTALLDSGFWILDLDSGFWIWILDLDSGDTLS